MLVSIHAPTRGATPPEDELRKVLHVSIHAPTRGATNRCRSSLLTFMFQSTHPHGVRLWSVVKPKEEEKVSIHAPTRGATPSPGPWTASGPSFNPRTHTGCDFIRFRISISSSVSIHAPTRGATTSDGTQRGFQAVSIHAPTRGATTASGGIICSCAFQSTHPHGVRLRTCYLNYEPSHVSIHAPTRGATASHDLINSLRTVSIHAPTRGATSILPHDQNNLNGFNPRTHTGCDPRNIRYRLRPHSCFNPRTHTGCDLFRGNLPF